MRDTLKCFKYYRPISQIVVDGRERHVSFTSRDNPTVVATLIRDRFQLPKDSINAIADMIQYNQIQHVHYQVDSEKKHTFYNSELLLDNISGT
jgi:hypothetical protein